ncbi:MAG: NADH-quinone oxidoreductase subunit NuoF [Synergistaceae bacterium]|nr:NADH-quinone oxidoreductase subunit NuoF [Synergistaceae bacterium]
MYRVLICNGTGCQSGGAVSTTETIRKEIEKLSLSDKVAVVPTGCHGMCEMGPIVVIYPEGWFYCRVSAEDAVTIVKEHIAGGKPAEHLMFREPNGKTVHTYKELPFYNRQKRIALRNCGQINPDNIDEYIANKGYEALTKALTQMTPESIIEVVKKSELRGRGGGGFPTGLKWSFCAKTLGLKKYVICNADEGDPGAFMDRSILEGDPHSIIEGMAIGAYAMGADEAYVYCRAEYPLAIKRLRTAITQAEKHGFTGNKILGTNFCFHIHIKEGAGAFVCGEETALMASIEGARGMPRPRPPFPAVSGLWGKPTNINNVETWANIPQIIINGPEWYASMGTEESKGTKVFALTGKVKHTGLVEVPMGIPIREIIMDIGGGILNDKKFKAVQIGGPSGGCLPEEYLDTPVSYEDLTKLGAIMGSGGLVVMDEDNCMVDVAKFFLEFTQRESCGKCVPCREGTKKMLDILTRICDGEGKPNDIEKLIYIGENVKNASLCGLGQTAPNPVLTTIKYFRKEYEEHIFNKKCPAGNCHALLSITITEACKGCGKCKKVCPVNAISGNIKEVHIIDDSTCVKCGACLDSCPFRAIRKM